MIEAISLKNKTKKTDVVNLTSPTEDETNDNNNDFLFLKDKNDSKEDEKKKKDKQIYEEEEHGNNTEEANKNGTRAELYRNRREESKFPRDKIENSKHKA